MIENKENMENYVQDLERYSSIMNYFESNKNRVSANINYLNDLSNIFKKAFFKEIDVSNIDVQERVYVKEEFRELGERMRNLLLQNLEGKLGMILEKRIKEGKEI